MATLVQRLIDLDHHHAKSRSDILRLEIDILSWGVALYITAH